VTEHHDALLPSDFLFGVATAGFQIEGGFNGPGEPANNWASWELEGRVEPSGSATNFWEDPESQLDLAKAAGLNSFRLALEWTRVEPSRGVIDQSAFDRYRHILNAIRERDMEPVVTLQHFTHPSWLGVEPWRDPETAPILAAWMDRAVGELGDLCSRWVTINEPGVLCINSFLTGIFPPGRTLDGKGWSASFDTLLAAHVLGYDAIHRRQPEALVTTNPYTFSIYELDQIGTDILMARPRGFDGPDVLPHLIEARREHYARIGNGGTGWSGRLERGLRRFAASQIPVADALPTTRAVLAASESPRHLDVVAVDHYAPIAASHLVVPGSQTAGGRWWKPGRALWDDAPDPSFMVTVLEEAGQYGLPVWVLENGMCNRVVRGRSYPRMDGLRRPQYLADHLGAVLAAVDKGVDVRGFWHWTLIDNYEWGSYEPRFGLYGMDRARGLSVSATDALGEDSAGAMRRIVEGLHGGDRSVVTAPRS
jgi:hypothetical protein